MCFQVTRMIFLEFRLSFMRRFLEDTPQRIVIINCDSVKKPKGLRASRVPRGGSTLMTWVKDK